MPAFHDFLKSRLRQPPAKAGSTTLQPTRQNKWQIRRRWLFLGLYAVLSLLVLSWTSNIVLRVMLQSSRWERNEVAKKVRALDGGKFQNLTSKNLKIATEGGLQADYKLVKVLGPEIIRLSDEFDRLGYQLHALQEKVQMLSRSSNKNEGVPEPRSTASKETAPSPPSGSVGPKPSN